MYEKPSFIRRVIEVPQGLQTAVAAAILYFVVQAEIWLSANTPIDFTGELQPLGAAAAIVLVFVVKAFLEHIIPEKLHGLMNTVLIWLAGFLAANQLLG